jgi:hypothetical protein
MIGTRRTHHDVGFVNRTGHILNGVCVYYATKMAAAAGVLVDGGRATFNFVALPIPAEAEVRWNENGVPHAVKVRLAGVVPHGFVDGTIYFIIQQDGSVSVKPIEPGDIDGNVGVTRSTP